MTRPYYPKCACGNDAYFHGVKGSESYELSCAACYVRRHERLGEQCVDGGKCHHQCGQYEDGHGGCFRRKHCGPLSGYQGVWFSPYGVDPLGGDA